MIGNLRSGRRDRDGRHVHLAAMLSTSLQTFDVILLDVARIYLHIGADEG